MAAMLTVLNKRWISQGWRAMDSEDAEPMAIVFIERLNREGIHYRYYNELYQRACELRISNLAKGLKPDEFSADMMAFCWPGLKAELRDREIEAGRTLTGYAQSQCQDCFGTGIKIIFDAEGNKIGAQPGCKHEHVDVGERDAAGFAMVEEALRRPPEEETAADICSRVRQQLVYLVATESDPVKNKQAWDASRTWMHAEKYCRENEG